MKILICDLSIDLLLSKTMIVVCQLNYYCRIQIKSHPDIWQYSSTYRTTLPI